MDAFFSTIQHLILQTNENLSITQTSPPFSKVYNLNIIDINRKQKIITQSLQHKN